MNDNSAGCVLLIILAGAVLMASLLLASLGVAALAVVR